MPGKSTNPVLDKVRRSLGRLQDSPLSPRPNVLPTRVPADPETEIERFLREVNALSGTAIRLEETGLGDALQTLVEKEGVKRAVAWPDERLKRLEIEARLSRLGVEIIPANADKRRLARCDLGVTAADFALPETGTLGLLSSPTKPRLVSLLPRVHLAILDPQALRPDLPQVFAEARDHNYLILISGPSRTSDIELTLTLGVHGPKALYVWVLD